MAETPSILIVDDHSTLLDALEEYLQDSGFKVHCAPDGETALEILGRERVDMAFIDMVMPGMGGMELLSAIKERGDTPVVMFTGYAEVGNALEAIDRGAYEFLTKPVAPETLPVLIANALDHRRLVLRDQARSQDRQSFGSLIGNSPAMQDVYDRILSLAASDAPVLLTGETGTGKNLVAREIHSHSSRSTGAFQHLNCTAISPTLFEAELFGHEKGAFTGAEQQRIGRFERAHQGTLMLDEIGSLPIELQGKLLSVLEEQEFERIGGTATIHCDVRIIAATNVDLRAEVQAGRFRQDLFFRLCTLPMHLPPLREHLEDLLVLVPRLLAQASEAMKRDVPAISQAAIDEARAHHWPGNVRELQNSIRHAVVTCRGERIDSILPPEDVQLAAPGALGDGLQALLDLNYQEAQIAFQRRYFEELVERFGGDKAAATAHADIDRRTLQRYLNRFHLEPEGLGDTAPTRPPTSRPPKEEAAS